MIQIVEAVPEDHAEIQNKAVQQVYAFALNRLVCCILLLSYSILLFKLAEG